MRSKSVFPITFEVEKRIPQFMNLNMQCNHHCFHINPNKNTNSNRNHRNMQIFNINMQLQVDVQSTFAWIVRVGLTGARVGDGAGSGATPSRRHTEVSEEARSSSAGSDTAAGRGTEGSGPHERHDRETAAEEQAVQTTSRGSRKPTLLCHLFIHPSFINLFYHDRLLLSVEFWLHVHRDYRFTSVCFRFCDS